MTDRGFDMVSFVAGVAVAALGALLLADQAGLLDLSLNLLGAAAAAALGAVLLASGLAQREPRPQRPPRRGRPVGEDPGR